MGRDKASLPLPDGPLIARPYRRLRPLVTAALVCGADTSGLPCPAVPDLVPGRGPLGGIVTALRAADSELVLVVACDMPDPDPRLADHLLARARADPTADAVVPRRAGRWEPLLAVYRRRAAGPLAAALADEVLACHLALARLRVLPVEEAEWRRLDPDGHSFHNWNTPADLPPPGATGARGPQAEVAMNAWFDRFLEGLEPVPAGTGLTPEEGRLVLQLAGEAAHTSGARQIAPLAAYLAGQLASGAGAGERCDRLRAAIAAAARAGVAAEPLDLG